MTATTPRDPAFYPATMSCKDLTITNAVAAAAFKAWQDEGIRSGYMRLTSHLEIAHRTMTGTRLEGHPHDRYELAHRIMQRARKAGFIEATGDRDRPWRTVEQPEVEIEKVLIDAEWETISEKCDDKIDLERGPRGAA